MSCDEVVLHLKQGDTWKQVFVLAAGPVPVSQGGPPRNITEKARGRLFSIDSGARTTRAEWNSANAGEVTIDGDAGEVTFHMSSTDTAAISGVGSQEQRWLFEFELYDDAVSPEYVETILTYPIIIEPD